MRNPFAPGTGLRRYTRKHLVHDRDAARAEVLRLEGEIRGKDRALIERDERISQLEADAVDVSVERKLREQAEARADDYESRYLALKARVDNEHAITVPPMRRDVDPDEEPTEPAGIDVRTLREALGTSAA
ncbi:hypothetical protein [Streptomyces sp. G1]|uniref:hypothetical protein n=1 Tax=Streptomyces sp. G1 TaxID=361572 RepID=UPI00203059E3|nr:hypothetical protein [Streptomyces sp. G1]MCM1974598.1 hypothetical protein [Streptomyces sp. G1]